MSSKTALITIRLNQDLRKRMDAARKAATYQPSITALVVRGIELACDEIEAMTKAEGKGRK